MLLVSALTSLKLGLLLGEHAVGGDGLEVEAEGALDGVRDGDAWAGHTLKHDGYVMGETRVE